MVSMTKAPQQRRSRLQPAKPKATGPLSPRSRHLEILEAALRYRFLGFDDIGEILGTTSSHRRIVTELFHAGLLQRHWAWTPDTRQGRGTPAALHVLTPKGLRVWADAHGLDLTQPPFPHVLKRVQARTKPKEGEGVYTEHAWAISRFQRSLERSAEVAGLTVRTFIADREYGAPEFTIPVPDIIQNPDASDRDRKPYTVRPHDYKFGIQPDATYVLRNPAIPVPRDWPEDQPRPDERCYVVEVDNARRKATRYLRRALGYLRLVTTEEGQEAIRQDLGYTTVDLVFVSPTRARRDQLWQLTLHTPGIKRDVLENTIFWFVALSDLLEEREVGQAAKRTVTVSGNRLFDRQDPIAVKLDGTPSPLAMPGFLLGRGRSR